LTKQVTNNQLLVALEKLDNKLMGEIKKIQGSLAEHSKRHDKHDQMFREKRQTRGQKNPRPSPFLQIIYSQQKKHSKQSSGVFFVKNL